MNAIAQLYDEVMHEMPKIRSRSTIQDLEAKIADRLCQLMAAELPMGVNTYGQPQVTSHVEGDQVVFTATVAIPHRCTAIEAMAQAIKDADK